MNIEALVQGIDKIDIESCLTSISQDHCVLFLGPNFAIDADGNKIHELIESKLKDQGYGDKLDFNYENLYLFKNSDSKSLEKVKLNVTIKKLYQSLKPSDIYNKIASIPFSAIISCSPDKYLVEAHNRQEFDYNFQHYSRKGVGRNIKKHTPNATYIYNVFGDIEVEDSTINTYESFYKFVMSIMGDQQVLPPQLTDRIADANIFLFMGFDLTKWYMPLMVHKLHSFKQESGDTIAVLNLDNTFNEQTPNFLPLELAISDNNSEAVIATLYNLLKDRNGLKSKTDKTISFEGIRDVISKNDLENSIIKLKAAYALRGLDTTELDTTSAQYEEYEDEKSFGILSSEEAGAERKKIVRALLQLNKKLR